MSKYQSRVGACLGNQQLKLCRTGFFLGFILVFVPVAVFTSAYAQLTKVNVASSGISPTQIIPYLAQEAGFYRKNGLDVSVIRTRAEIAVMSLLNGDTPLIDVAGPTIIRSNLNGADCVFIAAGAVVLNFWMMAGKGINTPQDLKGKVVGVAGLSGSALAATRHALGKVGLNPDKDIKIVQIGGTPDRLIALRTGRIQATLLSPPTSLAAHKEGFNLLVDVAGMPFQANGPATTRKFIREQAEVVRKYVKAHVETVHLMKTNRELWIKVLSKFVKVDRDILEKSYEVSVTEELFPRKQYPSLSAIATALDQVSETEPKAKASKPESFADSTFILELDKSGYIDSLYKRN
jgi:ABC-type nitrate/sulfonate/bicarbonate transport system substrate-binding protein